MSDRCQIDFYVLASARHSAERLSCRLSMKAWEQGHRVLVRVRDEAHAAALDELMWDDPPGRFLPHAAGVIDERSPVCILPAAEPMPDGRDLLINLTAEPVPDPGRFRRLLEIVPADAEQRSASREKYKAYRELGLEPSTHTIGKN